MVPLEVYDKAEMFGETKGKDVATGDISKSDAPSLFLRHNLKMMKTAMNDMMIGPIMIMMMMTVGTEIKNKCHYVLK